MTQERMQAEAEIARIMETARATGYKNQIINAILSYAQGLVEGQRLERMKEATA